jgi:cytochrome c biogenesis protein CcdA
MKKLLQVSSILAIVAGLVLIIAGAWAICFTYSNVAQEQIVTPEDASIPNTPVRGPLTLLSQAEIIRHHVLTTTGGHTYAEMSRTDPNRNMWVTATTLITALHLGIITYVFSVLVILLGAISIWTGIVFHVLSKQRIVR